MSKINEVLLFLLINGCGCIFDHTERRFRKLSTSINNLSLSINNTAPTARIIVESRCRDAAGSVRVNGTVLPHRIRIVRHHRQGSCHGGTTGRTTINSTARTRTMHLSRVERHTEKERKGHHQQSISFLLDGGGGGGGSSFVVAVVVPFFRCFDFRRN